MLELPAPSPSPARVHERARALTGHLPCWLRRPYRGGIYSIEHFRVCSYCGCIHPGDLIELLDAGRSAFEPTAKAGKFLLATPNPVAGDLVRMGSVPGPIFERKHEPADLRHRLTSAPRRELPFSPSIDERLMGHFERPTLEEAPAMINWPFYSEHTTDRQWAEIWTAATRGAPHATIQSA